MTVKWSCMSLICAIDEDYISFLESLKEASSKPFDADTLETLSTYFFPIFSSEVSVSYLSVASTQPAPLPTTTPLLEALKAEKSAQKDKEAIIRNHAHYKDPATLGSLSKKDDKKKGGSSAAKEKSADAQAGASKKGSKKAAAAAKAAQQQSQSQAGTSKESKTAPSTPSKQGAGKPPKPPRERKGTISAPASKGTPSSLGPTAATAGAPAPADGGSGEPSRRPRPMLGLASRQFEAALSGAGVERKSRREREKEKDKGQDASGAPSSDPPAHAQKAAKEEKRERAPRGQPVPPTILQRDAQGAPAPPKILTPHPTRKEDSRVPRLHLYLRELVVLYRIYIL